MVRHTDIAAQPRLNDFRECTRARGDELCRYRIAMQMQITYCEPPRRALPAVQVMLARVFLYHCLNTVTGDEDERLSHISTLTVRI